MTSVQMNIRIDEKLKKSGDEILEQQHISASSLIRGVWQYMSNYQTLPNLQNVSCDEEIERETQRKLRLAEKSSGMAHRMLEEAGLINADDDLTMGKSYQELRELAYKEKYQDYLDEANDSKHDGHE